MVRAPGLGHEPARSGEVSVTEVLDRDELAICSALAAAGFGAPELPAPAALLGGARRFWLARHRGPVAAASAFVGEGVVDVEAVATLSESRGQGFGTAVTWAATLTDPALPAVLLASGGL